MKKILGVLVYENTQPIDFIGPWEVFSYWKNSLQAPIEMCLVSEHGSYVQCMNNIMIKTHYDFNHSPQLDYLIIPGGKGRLNAVNNEKLIAFIKKQAKNAQYILSVCTGMFLLHKADLLHAQLVTTYWRALSEAKTLPDVTVVEERIIKNNKIWLAAGISSGIDLAFEFIAEIAGKECAGKTQLLYENFPKAQVYCTPELFRSLPPYDNGLDNELTHLPKYIREYIKKHQKAN